LARPTSFLAFLWLDNRPLEKNIAQAFRQKKTPLVAEGVYILVVLAFKLSLAK
jgi:hypothetical protein